MKLLADMMLISILKYSKYIDIFCRKNVSSLKATHIFTAKISMYLKLPYFVCVEVLRPSQPNGVMSSAVSLPNHTFTGQA